MNVDIMKYFIIVAAAILLVPSAGVVEVPHPFMNEDIKEHHTYSLSLNESAQPLFSSSIHIYYPRCSDPVIVEPGDNFTVIFESKNFTSLAVAIETSYDEMPDEFTLSIIKTWYDGMWNAVVEVPEIPYELYNLTLSIDGDVVTEPRAVAIQEIKQNFTFIHVTDFHIGDPRGLRENISQTIGWKAAKKIIEEVNLLHPDFVIITGDLVFGQLYPFEYSFEYRKLYRILQMFDIPTYLCPGNHDGYVQTGQDGFKIWQKYFGPLYYSFDYGDAHFIMANSYDWPKISRKAISYAAINWGGYIGDEQLRWIENDLKNSDARLKIVALHHNPLWETTNDSLLNNPYHNRKELLNLIWTYGVDAVLDGHVHYDDVTVVNNTLFLTTTTCASSLSSDDAYWGYRKIEVRDWKIVSYNYKEPKFSIPSYKINIERGENYVMITNTLDIPITVHVGFYLPYGAYTIKNGEVMMKRLKGDMLKLYVKADVNSNDELRIKLA